MSLLLLARILALLWKRIEKGPLNVFDSSDFRVELSYSTNSSCLSPPISKFSAAVISALK